MEFGLLATESGGMMQQAPNNEEPRKRSPFTGYGPRSKIDHPNESFQLTPFDCIKKFYTLPKPANRSEAAF